jgi:KOW motif-containing protein
MAKAKPFSKGDVVTAKYGKHAGETGTVEHSDKSITIVKFDNVSDPVWTEHLEREA